MIKIDRNNYEKYMIDLLEGKLSASEQNQVIIFLEQNPDIKKELDFYEKIDVTSEKINFTDKAKLKKESILEGITQNNFEELCIAKLEGDLDEKELLEFNNLIKSNRDKERDYQRFALTKLIPDNTVVYADKKTLKQKKSNFIIRRQLSLISIAASIALLILFYFYSPINKNKLATEVDSSSALNENIIDKNENQNKIANSNNPISEKNTKQTITKVEGKPVKVKVEELEKNIIIKEKEEMRGNLAYLHPIHRKIESDEKEINIDRNVTFYSLLATRQDVQDEITFKEYLARVFNKKVLNKEEKEKIELFDLAQAGVKGINKLTGSKMTLERTYDKNGNPDKTTFNSRLIAFSTPAKKN